MHGTMPGMMIGKPDGDATIKATNGTPRLRFALSLASIIFLVALGSLGCLTPGQTRSVGQQLGEIRQQAEQVRSEQRNMVDSIGQATPVARQSGVTATDPHLEPSGTPSRQTGETSTVVVADHESGPQTATHADNAIDERLYREGYALYHRRDYQAAEQHLRRFLASDPEGPMADDALFWIGECRFARGLYRDAIFEYRSVIDLHSGSSQVPRAWYMIALSYERLGEPAAMKDHLAMVVDKFPESDVAPLARDRLSTL